MIDKKIEEISNHFLNDLQKDDRHTSISLLSGRSGTVLFLTELYKLTGDKIYKAHIDENLQYIMDVLDKSDKLGATFCDGIAGWGWLIEFLKEEKLISDEYDSILSDLDDILEEQVDAFISQKNFDLLHGLLGLGAYFLKRKKALICEKILRCVAEMAIETDSEVKFMRLDILREKEDIFDLGLPHGNIGTLYFLSKCYNQDILPTLSERLIKGVITFYLNNIQPIETAGSYFPSNYPVRTYETGNNEAVPSRMAWCYGDLTILYGLYNCCRLLELSDLAVTVLSMLTNLTKRKHPVLTSISDATFCHGSTGAAYLFLKLYKATGESDFNEAANYWLEKTLEFGNRDGYGGYLFEVSNLKKYILAPSSGLLEGIGGIGLVLISFKNDHSRHSWDECFFLT